MRTKRLQDLPELLYASLLKAFKSVNFVIQLSVDNYLLFKFSNCERCIVYSVLHKFQPTIYFVQGLLNFTLSV